MIAKEGIKWILFSSLPVLFLLFFNSSIAYLFIILPFFVCLFFRDPERDSETKGIISPADGKVISIQNSKNIEISIFMRLHDVHVNRIPVSGNIIRLTHEEGKHFPAFLASENEKIITKISTDNGTYKVSQVAGLIARRITPYIREGQTVQKGERLGIIAFGSRVDLEFPEDYEKSDICVNKGDRVKAGKTRIAK